MWVTLGGVGAGPEVEVKWKSGTLWPTAAWIARQVDKLRKSLLTAIERKYHFFRGSV